MENKKIDQNKDHPLSEKQTNTDDSKVETTTAILTDPDFPLPTLDSKSSTLDHVKSFTVLACLVSGGILGAWYMEASLLQTTQPVFMLGGIFLVMMIALFATGTVWIDWWELVLGYWWLSMPIGAAAGLAIVLNQEAQTPLGEVS